LGLGRWSGSYQYENQEGEETHDEKQFPNGNIFEGYNHFHFSTPPGATIIDRAPKRIFRPTGEMMGKKGKGSRGQRIPGAFKGAPSGNSTS
jgi:hypothetical protein